MSYWQRRFEAVEALEHGRAEITSRAVADALTLAQRDVQKQIESWAQRFAVNNRITMTEARKWLAGSDLEELRWDVEQYIQYGRENALTGQWMRQLENASARWHISRLEAVQLRMEQAVQAAYKTQGSLVRELLGEVYSDGYYRSVYELQKGVGAAFEVAAVDQETLETLLKTPWTTDGKTFSDRVWASQVQLTRELQTQLTRQLLTGGKPEKAISAIQDAFGVAKYQARRLVMTETAHFQVEAQRASFENLDVEEFEVCAAGDARCCETCGDMHDRHFPMRDFQEGVSAPPFHPNCRCCISPWFPDEDFEDSAFDQSFKDWQKEWLRGEGDGKALAKPSKKGYNDFRQEVQEKIGKEYPLNVNQDQQSKHVAVSKNYEPGRSTLTADPELLIQLYAGKGEPIQTNAGEWNQRERFTHTSEIGIWRNSLTGEEAPTNRGIIHYTKRKGAHIVPANPQERSG